MSGFYTALTFLLGGKRFPEHFWKALASPRLRKRHCKHLDKRLRNSVSQPHITFSRPSKETHVQGEHSQYRTPPVSACGKHGGGGGGNPTTTLAFSGKKKKGGEKKKIKKKEIKLPVAAMPRRRGGQRGGRHRPCLPIPALRTETKQRINCDADGRL